MDCFRAILDKICRKSRPKKKGVMPVPPPIGSSPSQTIFTLIAVRGAPATPRAIDAAFSLPVVFPVDCSPRDPKPEKKIYTIATIKLPALDESPKLEVVEVESSW